MSNLKNKNVKNIFFIAGLTALLTGCAPPPGGYRTPLDDLRDFSYTQVLNFSKSVQAELATSMPEAVLEKSKNSIANTLKDPESAKFRNVRLVKYLEGSVICGEVNGKNSYGGYVGFKPFVASTTLSMMYSTSSKYESTNAAANAGINAACN